METAHKPAASRTTATDSPVDTDAELTPREAWEPIMEWLGLRRFDLDPCSHAMSSVPVQASWTPPNDGLSEPWWGTCWVNPPYSRPSPWVVKAREHADAGGAAVMRKSSCLGDVGVRIAALWREMFRESPSDLPDLQAVDHSVVEQDAFRGRNHLRHARESASPERAQASNYGRSRTCRRSQDERRHLRARRLPRPPTTFYTSSRNHDLGVPNETNH